MRDSRKVGHRFRPRPLLSTADFAMRRGAPVLNGSLTIIVLTPLTTFSASACSRAWNPVGKRMNSLEYFYRDVGSSKGPPQARDRFTRALPCLALIAFDGTLAQAQTLTPDLFRPARDGFVSPQDSPLRRTSEHHRRQDRRCRQRRAAARQGHARAVADRPDSDLRPSRRQRRIRLRLRLAQPHAQEAETLSGPGQAETAAGSRQPAAPAADPNGRCGCRSRRPRPPTRRRSRRRWPAPWSASRRASA